MPAFEFMPVRYTEKGFLAALGLDGPGVLGLHALKLNGRWIAVPDEVREVEVVLAVLKEEDGK